MKMMKKSQTGPKTWPLRTLYMSHYKESQIIVSISSVSVDQIDLIVMKNCMFRKNLIVSSDHFHSL